MNLVDYPLLIEKIIGHSIPRNEYRETYSGHAAGEPFDKHVYSILKEQHVNHTYRQYEYLNDLFLRNPEYLTYGERQNLLNYPTILFLLSRGKNATGKWSVENPFEEKQNDTADILVVKDDYFEIIDIKTRNISKSSQPPNIISAFKLAQVCAIMIDNEDYNIFSINYFEIDWILTDSCLVCKDAHYSELFKANPESLYINWAAAMQLQFHVIDLDQSYRGTMEEWARKYIKHFVEQAKRRSADMIIKFVNPFEKYIF